MNPYIQKRYRKIILFFCAVVIAGVSLWYTNDVIKNISKAEHTRAQVWAKSTSRLATMRDLNGEDLTFILSIQDSLALPAIVTDSAGAIVYYQGLDTTKTNIPAEKNKGKRFDPDYFRDQLRQMSLQHPPILLGNKEKWRLYYKDSLLLTQLRIFPHVRRIVIIFFLMIAYYLFSSSRRSEQDQVWLGLAKETAHQLGTPISSLMAWTELLKTKLHLDKEPLVLEMENDIRRLEIIADRFSKIGSKPILKSQKVYQIVVDFVDYFKARVSDKIKFRVRGDIDAKALINRALFDWVLENLLKNAVNAMEGHGKIEIHIFQNLIKRQVFIDIADTGKGIPRLKFDTIFQPGYTTRKHGWGLGLSLTKRIVENYHKGRVFVKQSEIGKGSTLRIILRTSLN